VRQKRTIIGTAGVALLSVILAACGSSAPKAASSSSSTSTTKSAKPVTITFWNEMTGPYKKALAGDIDAFEATHPNVKVEDIVVPNDAALEPKLLAGVVGHTLPTLSQLNPQWGDQFIKTHSLVDLTPYIEKSSNFGLSDFFSKMISAGRWPGNKQYMLPFNLSDSMMFYNEAAFAKAGITAPPKTWAEYYADAKKLSGGNDHAFAITLVHSYPWRAFFYEAGGHFATSSGKPDKTSLSSSGAAEAALALWGKMVKNGYAVLTQGYASQTDFSNQTSSILIGTSAFYPYLAKAVGGKFKIGIAPMPSDKTTSTSLFGGYLGMFSQASSAQKQAAFEFIQYLTSEKGQSYWMEHSEGYLPVRKDAATAAQAFLASHPAQATGLEQLADATPEPNFPWWDQFDNRSLIPAIQAVLIGKETPAAAAASLYSGALAAEKAS